MLYSENFSIVKLTLELFKSLFFYVLLCAPQQKQR